MNCPHCDRLLYSRRSRTCHFCGGVLPAEVRLSDDEIAKQKAEQFAMDQRRAAEKAQEEEEREAAARRGDGGGAF